MSVPTLLPKLAISGDMENVFVFLLRATCLWFSAWHTISTILHLFEGKHGLLKMIGRFVFPNMNYK